MSNALTTIPEITLTEMDGVPRARDIAIGERLGYERSRAIRQTIERNKAELEAFGPLATVCGKSRGQDYVEYWLNEEQALLIATLSDAPNAAAVRAMLIRVFVAWRRGHLNPALPADVLEMVRRTDGISRMLSHKVTEIEKTLPAIAAQIAGELLPAMLQAAIAAQSVVIRRGKTAGQIWRDHGFPKLKVTCWFGNRLKAAGCAIEGGGCGELGLTKARLFDPDKADLWLRNGGRLLVEQKIAERRGQSVIPFPKAVQGPSRPAPSSPA